MPIPPVVLTLKVSQYTVTCLSIFSSDLGFYTLCWPWQDAYGTIPTSGLASVAPFPRNGLKTLHNSMASAERDQNPLWLSASLWTGDTPSCGLHLSEVIFVTRLVYLLLVFFLIQLPRGASRAAHCKVFLLGGRSSHCLCQGSSFVSRSAGGKSPSDGDSFLYLSPHPHSCPPHHSSPMFRVTVQSFGTLPSPDGVDVIMLWPVLLNGSAGITSPMSSWALPRFESPPCLYVLHSCSWQEITIREIPSL